MEAEKERDGLEKGRLVGEQVRFCQDSVRLTFGAPSAGVSVQRLDSSGKREDQGAVLKTGLGAALGKTYETVWVAPQKESRTADFVEVLSALYDQGQVPAMQPLIAEEVDFLTLSAGSPVVHTPYWSAKADYDSYLSNQWVSLIPLKFGKRHDGSCVDPLSPGIASGTQCDSRSAARRPDARELRALARTLAGLVGWWHGHCRDTGG